MPDFSLFPKSEEWGTGDEALDLKLSLALKKAQQDLTLVSIRNFLETGSGIKTRAYNPSFLMLIEMVTKALLHFSAPGENVYDLMNKLKGHYEERERICLTLPETQLIKNELQVNKHSRYHNQLDFYLQLHSSTERNPFLKESLNRGEHTLLTKIIFKELKLYLSGEIGGMHDQDPLLRALAEKKKTVFIEGFAELWYDQGHIFTLSLIS